MTELWPQSTYTESLVKFGCVVYEICEPTDRQTCSTIVTVFHIPPGMK